jgi:hypothetical protein
MHSVKIRIYKRDESKPDTTISIPVGILRFATKLMPKQVLATLLEYGVDLKEIVELAQQDEVQGTLVEIEKHRKDEKIIISIE